MRIDEETGQEVPETLREYLTVCEAIGGPDCDAVDFLRNKIKTAIHGEEERVVACDSQIHAILVPLLRTKNGEPI